MIQLEKRENLIHIIKFTLFSISAGIIQIISFTILNEVVKLIYWPAYLIALTLSVLWNFTLNRKFTFKSAANIPKAMFKVACFYLVFTPLSTWWGDSLEAIGWNEYVILGMTMIINFVTEFIFTKFYVYKNNINTAVKKL
ncbi:MAG: GtrA family protein [Tenericutes bacterium HGW-Tenericutes-5]|nr:MAG: GtrA family protein [Tenericutes bacterium HGW-Tenericutes-5]